MSERESQGCDQVEIRLSAAPEYLCVVRCAVGKVAEVVGLDEQEREAVTLALEEALANVIRHSYGGPCGQPIIVKLAKLARDDKTGALEIVVRDFGKQVDPASIQGRDLSDIKPGGLGVHIIRSTMDEVEYSQAAEGGMKLRMVKYFALGGDVKRGKVNEGSG